MKTVDIMEMVTNAIEKTIFKDWKHEGFIGGFTSEHINFEIDGREYVLRIKEVEEGQHWSERATNVLNEATSIAANKLKEKTLQDYLNMCGEPEKRYGSYVY